MFWGDKDRPGYCQPPIIPDTNLSEKLSRWEKEPAN
jgi:hypothetical protein